MIAWIVFSVAVLVAVVLLSFCAYEVSWKSRRLQADVARLQAVRADVARVQEDLAETRDRARHVAARRAAARPGR